LRMLRVLLSHRKLSVAEKLTWIET